MVTQKDVASLAGVSFITVSRVINGEKNVREETRRKVQDAINTLNYSPSFAGQALNSGRCNTIAVLTPIPLSQTMQTLYLTNVLAGVERACKKQKVDILFETVPESEYDSHFDYLRTYKQRKVDGIIFIGLKRIPEEMTEEIQQKTSNALSSATAPQANCFHGLTQTTSAQHTAQSVKSGKKDTVKSPSSEFRMKFITKIFPTAKKDSKAHCWI